MNGVGVHERSPVTALVMGVARPSAVRLAPGGFGEGERHGHT
jgi:hypothetical protein